MGQGTQGMSLAEIAPKIVKFKKCEIKFIKFFLFAHISLTLQQFFNFIYDFESCEPVEWEGLERSSAQTRFGVGRKAVFSEQKRGTKVLPLIKEPR